MDRQCRCPDVIVRAPVCDNDHDLTFVRFGFAKELVCCKGDGGPGAGPATPVVNALDGVQQLCLVIVLSKCELQPLLIGVLHGSHSCVCVRDLKLPCDVGHKLQHSAEVARPNAAGTVDHEGDVVGVEASLAAHQAVCVTHPLHQRLDGLSQSKPAVHRKGEEAVCSAHSLWDEEQVCQTVLMKALTNLQNKTSPSQQSWPQLGFVSRSHPRPRW